jgi:guanylate kinase
MHYIIGLIGPSGSGKSSLMAEVMKRLPQQTGVLVSITTRERRGPEDDVYYQFLSREEYLRLRDSNELATDTEYANNLYGYKKDFITEGLKRKHLFCAVVESVAQQLLDQKYPTKLIRLNPINQKVFRGETRLAADQARSKIKIPVDKEIANSFEPGGFEKAVEELAQYIQSL